MNDKKIILNDGTVIVDANAAMESWSKKLMIEIPGNNIVKYVSLFGNPDVSSKIVFYDGINKYVYNGYKSIINAGYDEYNNKLDFYLYGENTSFTHEYTVPNEYIPEALR